MRKLDRSYYRLADAAEQLGYSPDDLLHLAVTGKTRLGVLFAAEDVFDPIHVIETTTTEDDRTRRDLVEFSGDQSFAYVDGGDLAVAEKTGKCVFSFASLPDGRQVSFGPGHHAAGINHATVAQLFMHRTELTALMGQRDSEEGNDVQPNTVQGSAGVGIDRNKVMKVFRVMPKDSDNRKYWDEKLGRPPKWLSGARLSSGRRSTSGRWDPLLVAHALLGRRTMTLPALDAAVRDHFPESIDAWREQTEDMRRRTYGVD